ncbi:hypothetical protein Tco_1568661 [Tanacetum coccineum]
MDPPGTFTPLYHHLVSNPPPPNLGHQGVASTQALINAVTAALPSPPLPPRLPSLYIPPHVDRRDDIPESEQPPAEVVPVDSPTAESPGYVTESDPEEDPEEYEDDETEDGPVDYPMDGGDDGDDDDGDSSRDDANDEDEDDEDEEEEEEEHLAPADSAIVVPVDEPVFPPEGTEPVIPPPSTDITIGARITIRPQASISLPPEAKVERLLAMTTPSPSPPISLSPPSAGEHLARCMALPAHSLPLLLSSGCLTQIQTLGIASTQALINAVTAALPSPPLPPQPPSLYIPPPVDHAEERRQGISDVRYGIRDTWVDPAEAVLEIAPMTVGEIVEEEAYASRKAWAHSIGLSQATHQELQTHHDHVHKTHFQMQQAELAALQETDRRRQDQIVETLRVIKDIRREMNDMHAELLALRVQQRRARQPGPEARIPDYQDASGDADSHI